MARSVFLSTRVLFWKVPPVGELIPDVERIAVLRAGGLGDFVFALPALESLRAAYPAAEITLLTGPRQHELVEARPGPWDIVEVVPAYPGICEDEYSGESANDFLKRMRRQRFDLAVQMHGGGRHSNRLVCELGARITVGCCTSDALPLDVELPHIYRHSESVRWLELVALIGGRFRATAPRLAITAADLASTEDVLPPLATEVPIVTLHPGAGSPRRRWPAAAFASLADDLTRAGARVVLVGGPEDCGLTGAVREGMSESAVDLGGRVSLSGLVGLFARAALHVGNDSGPAHIARAVAPATLTLMWGPNMLTAGPIGPASHHRAVLGWRVECPDCGVCMVDHDCEHDSTMIADIDPDEVRSQALELLGRQ